MTPDEIKGWNAALDFVALWLRKAKDAVPDEGKARFAVLGEVLNICESERK